MHSYEDENLAKLDLAAVWGLQAKFTYQGERDFAPRERRVMVEAVSTDDSSFGGESYDHNGQSEGYRSFRIDRITGKVAIR